MLEKYSFSSERACGFSTVSLERAWSPVPTLSGVLPQWNCSHANPRAHGLKTWPSPWHMATIFFHEHMHVCVFLHVTCRRLISVKRIRILTKQESIMKQNNNTTKKIQTKRNKTNGYSQNEFDTRNLLSCSDFCRRPRHRQDEDLNNKLNSTVLYLWGNNMTDSIWVLYQKLNLLQSVGLSCTNKKQLLRWITFCLRCTAPGFSVWLLSELAHNSRGTRQSCSHFSKAMNQKGLWCFNQNGVFFPRLGVHCFLRNQADIAIPPVLSSVPP